MARCETSNGTDNFVGSPRWAADFIDPRHKALVPFPAKVDPTQFTDAQAVTVQLTAAALQNATQIAITAIVLPLDIKFIPAGTVLYFGGAKVAVLTEMYTDKLWNIDPTVPYTTGTQMNVQALPTALAGTENALWEAFPSRCQINSGTLVSRTFADRDAGNGFHPAIYTDDEFFVTAFDVQDANLRSDVHLIRAGIGFGIKENYLPQWTALNTPTAVVNAVNEVQTVTQTAQTGGYSVLSGINAATGKKVYSGELAWNGNLAAIQVAVDAVFGAGLVVAAGTINAFTLTYSGAGYAGMPQPLIGLDVDALVGYTAANVAHTTNGVAAVAAQTNPLLVRLRSLYNCIKGYN
jgi:hypothetical protein